MFNFKKKSDSVVRDNDLLIVSDGAGEKSLAFGMLWRSIVQQGADARKAAVKVARAAGATHTLFRTTQYGFGRINRQSLEEASTRIWPAAMVVARQNAGNGIYVIRVFEDEASDMSEYWLAVTRNGQPTSIDKVILSTNSLEVVNEAKKLIKGGVDEEIVYEIYTNLEGEFKSLGDGVHRFGPEDIFACNMTEDDLLVAIPKAQSSIPKPVLVVLGIAFLLLVGQQGWKKYQAYDRARQAKLNVVIDEPPAQAWARATAKWAAERAAASGEGLKQARLSLGRVPLLWGGWKLETASCTAAPMSAAAPLSPAGGAASAAPAPALRTWSCSARYGRPAIGRENREVVENVPEGWLVKFNGLSQLDASWSFQQAASPLVIADLKPSKYHMVETASVLQGLLPAFSQAVAFSFVPAAIAPPKKKDGTAVPMDASVPQLKQAELVIKAPLRSIDALLAQPFAVVDWSRLSLTFAASASLSNSSLKSSSLSAEAQGVIYAKE